MSTRKLASAVSWLSLGNVMTRALSFVTMPILTRFLSPESYGVAALVGTLVSLASVFAIAGIDMSYSRHAFSGRSGTVDAVEIFCWRWVLAGAALVACVAGGLWWIAGVRLGAPRTFAGFVMAGVFFSALMTMSQTRARLQYRYLNLTWVQLVTACFAAVTSIGMAVYWRQDAWPLLAAMVLGYALPVLLLGTPPLVKLRAPSGLAARQRRSVFTTGLAGIITAPAYWALSSSDRWFLAAYQDSATVGIYSIGFTVGTVGAVVSSAITAAWLPELSRDESMQGSNLAARKSDMTHLLVAALLIVAVAVAASGGDVIRALADARFHAAAAVVPWLAAGVFFYGVMHVGNAMLVMRGKLHWAAWAWLIALLVSLGLNSWLVPRDGASGAALTQAISFFLVMVLVWKAVLRYEPLPLLWGRLLVGLVLAVLTAVAMQFPWQVDPWFSLVLKLPVGLVFAALCLVIVAPRTSAIGWNTLKGIV
ncbi:MAG TPA: lipopolysaccharide biosynthesis protein [Chiayiivirga sp.]|nr:lipopolysaccharide biosynthesis protein [Chiayiivirga sp.]